MAKITTRGLARAQELYHDRSQRVRELKAEGKGVIGYLCIYPPTEMITAFDLVPYRLFGDISEPVTAGDRLLASNNCAFLRSCLDLGMKGKYDFLAGTAFAHICECGQRVHYLWRISVDLPYTFYIDTPHVTEPVDVLMHKDLLKEFQESLETCTGKKLSPRRLKEAIELHNQQRALVRQLYDLKKPDPPLISGTETIVVLKAVMSLPVEEGSQLLRDVISEVKQRKDGPTKKSGRLLIWGPVIDYTGFTEMIESLDANVVMDDYSVGSRAFFDDVKITDDPLDGLAYHYLVDLKCARTVRESVHGATKKEYDSYLQARFGYLKPYITDWKVNGVVIEVMRYCDAHGYDMPLLNDYIDSLGLPHVSLEQDYSEASLAPMRTRVQGLIEIVSG